MALILNNPRVIEFNAQQDYLHGDSLALIELLKSDKPLSSELLTFVAGILEGTIKKKRGVKTRQPTTLGEVARPIMLLFEVKKETEWLELKNSSNPKYGFDARGEALEIVAKQHNLTPDRLDKIIYPRKPKKQPKLK